jgi:serine-type D-Ala-D-Ala carboxypeptidase/endopeptidase (penicillin-binding protein 4)
MPLFASLIVGQLLKTDPLLDPKLKGAIVGAIVTDVKGRVLYEKNADTRLMPASNEKILTCAFALARRGASFRPRTDFWVEGSKISIAAYGNPTLKYSDLKAIKDVYSPAEISLFQSYRSSRPDTWQIGDAPNRYAPATTAFTIEKAGVELWREGGNLVFKPYDPGIAIYGKNANAPFQTSYEPLAGLLTYTGFVPSGRQMLDTYSVPKPDESAIFALTGSRQFTELDQAPTTEPTKSIEGPSMETLLKDCLEPSDNCLAEHLLMLGSQKRSQGEATKALGDWLTGSLGIDKASINIADGCGLSRKNNVTARTISKVLAWAYQQPTKEIWMEALAKPGEGTLKGRLGKIEFFGKTGTLDMASALSGYVRCKDGSTKIVSVIMNHYACTASEARGIQDRFIENVSQ